MPRTCTICGHDLRHEINVALAQREPYRHIASHYGVSTGALQRHSKDHLPKLLVEASQAVEVAKGEELLARVEELRGEAMGVLAAAKEEHDHRTVLAAIDRASRQLELLARLLGELQENQINIHLHPEWLEVKALILTALGPHPAAREAVFHALTEAPNGNA